MNPFKTLFLRFARWRSDRRLAKARARLDAEKAEAIAKQKKRDNLSEAHDEVRRLLTSAGLAPFSYDTYSITDTLDEGCFYATYRNGIYRVRFNAKAVYLINRVS